MKIKPISQLYQNPTFIIFTIIHELSKNITNIYMYIINLVYKYQINYITIFITIMILKQRKAFHCQQQQTHKMKKKIKKKKYNKNYDQCTKGTRTDT